MTCEQRRISHVGSVAAITRCCGKSWIPKTDLLLYIDWCFRVCEDDRRSSQVWQPMAKRMLADNLRKKKLGISRRVENGRVGGMDGVHSLCKFWLVVLTIQRSFLK